MLCAHAVALESLFHGCQQQRSWSHAEALQQRHSVTAVNLNNSQHEWHLYVRNQEDAF